MSLSAQERVQNAREFFDPLVRQNSDGTYYYSDEDVKHVLPFVLMTIMPVVNQLPASAETVLNEFIAEAELPANPSPVQLVEGIARYYEKYPPNKELIEEVLQALKKITLQQKEGTLSEGAKDLLGIAPETFAPVDEKPAGGSSLLNVMLGRSSDEES